METVTLNITYDTTAFTQEKIVQSVKDTMTAISQMSPDFGPPPLPDKPVPTVEVVDQS